MTANCWGWHGYAGVAGPVRPHGHITFTSNHRRVPTPVAESAHDAPFPGPGSGT